MDTRRLLLAIGLSLAVVVGWQLLFPPPRPTRPPVPPPAAVEKPAAPGATVPGGPTVAPAPVDMTPIAAASEERVVLANAEVEAVFSNRGAQLVSFQLKKHRTAAGKAMDLVRARTGAPYPFGLVTADWQAHPLDGALFRVERGAGEVTFVFRGPEGAARKHFRLGSDGFLDGEVTVDAGAPWGLLLGPGVRQQTAEELSSQFEHRGAAYRDAAGKVEQIDSKKAEKVIDLRPSSARWVALEDTYFLAAAIPQKGVRRMTLQPVYLKKESSTAESFAALPGEDERTEEQEKSIREVAVALWPEGREVGWRSYWGTKEYDRLKAAGYGLEGTVRLGMFGFLALPLLKGLHFIYDRIVSNYGWAIVLMTLFIRLLLLPLTHYSMVSMRKMQDLNPKMQAIRERYRSKLKDKQGRPNLEAQRKMNEEVMALYKQEGVNPAGGCLPILLQMPVLFAFYAMLSTAVELRGAPWALWIHDLATRDPTYVLPIVMGLTQFLQVRLAPQAGDPMQRRLFQLMPLVMTVLFVNFPSGLVLYWLTNNVLTIIQQAVYGAWKKEAKA